MPDIICKLTGLRGPGIKAHVIPRSLFQFGAGGGKILQVGENFYSEKRSPIGEYDSEILIIEGERHFSDCDSYAAEFFLNSKNGNQGKVAQLIKRRFEAPTAAIMSPGDFDPFLLRKLCMSILWRAGVSNRPFFAGVQLGRHEERLRHLILNNDVGSVEDFTIFLARWEDTPIHGRPTLRPYRSRMDGFNGYQFHISQFSFFIKVDSRPFPPDLLPCAVGGDPYLPIFFQGTFKDSKVGRVTINSLKEQTQKRATAAGMTLEQYLDQLEAGKTG